ncbi:MAG: formyltetrahydrofolate deformylase [Solirubrobacteraceae bacterium]
MHATVTEPISPIDKEAPPTPSSARLLVSCADRPGIVAAVSKLLAQEGANITTSDQHTTDPQGGEFFMRIEFQIPDDALADLEQRFDEVAGRFGMEWRLSPPGERKRVALMVSRPDHCLLDLLWRWRRGELDCDIPLVVSNHPDLRSDVAMFGVRYVHVPVERDKKAEAEARLLELFGREYDLIVLARYMQVLSGDFLGRVGTPIINIHHSFLPAFAGASPYAQARARGVKLIGATAHYVNEALDAGPIIEQDTARVSHRDTAETLERIGRDVERTVLARAVKWHLEDRVVVSGNRTVAFT